jgi:hypothetical protein
VDKASAAVDEACDWVRSLLPGHNRG